MSTPEFQIRFKLTGAAFEDENRIEETARILRGIAERIDAGRDSGTVHDINGNRIGEWSMDDPE